MYQQTLLWLRPDVGYSYHYGEHKWSFYEWCRNNFVIDFAQDSAVFASADDGVSKYGFTALKGRGNCGSVDWQDAAAARHTLPGAKVAYVRD